MIQLRLFYLISTLYFVWMNGYSSIPDSTGKSKMELVFQLPAELIESSGLIYFHDEFWSFNDSGGEPILYAIDPLTGKILRRVTITNATNIDWEEVTQDEKYIYIGDFGNNYGDRKDLKIYRISKTDMIQDKTDYSILASIISFSFSDQRSFKKRLLYTRYDCEAMIVWKDSIVVFTKNWIDETSSVYCFPKMPGTYNISSAFVFRSQGLVTGAAISDDAKELAICGYEEFIPFVWLIKLDNSIDFRRTPKTRRSYISMSGVQTEGICYGPGGYLYLSCERSLVPQSLFRLNPTHLRKSP
jgi:hypothetical protein